MNTNLVTNSLNIDVSTDLTLRTGTLDLSPLDVVRKVTIDDLVNIVLNVLDARDPYTFGHSLRVTEIATLIARDMQLPSWQLRNIIEAAYLHDIGKTGITDKVLNKAGLLTREEMKHMQAHPRIGYNILKQTALFKDIADIVLCHHERWDGLGYPNGLAGEDIPIESRIIAVSDAFDAITSDRPYRKGQPIKYAVKEIYEHKEEQFGPVVVEHFLNVYHLIPEVISDLNVDAIQHAFEGHDDLMHSRRLL